MVSGRIYCMRGPYTDTSLDLDAENQDLHIMGLNTSSGRLGVASFKNVYRSTKLPRLLSQNDGKDYEIADVAIGRETCMVHVIDYS